MKRPLFRGLAARLRRRGGRWVQLADALGPPDEDDATGVREPRRPREPSLSGGVALDEPSKRDEP